jgi:hypothetical protein
MGTVTVTKTFTITEARYVTSKIAADLRQIYLFYGVPDSDSIPNFAEEAALLLRDGYLESVDYGLKRNGSVIFAIRYVARSDGSLVRDDSSGRIVPGLDFSGASWFSYCVSLESSIHCLNPSGTRSKVVFPFKGRAAQSQTFPSDTRLRKRRIRP